MNLRGRICFPLPPIASIHLASGYSEMTTKPHSYLKRRYFDHLSLLIAMGILLNGFGVYAGEFQDRHLLESAFTSKIRPFLETYCIDCHGENKPKAKFSLSPFKSLDTVITGHQFWEHVIEKLVHNEMPPEDADELPSQSEVTSVIDWYESLQRFVALKNDGDPGTVLARRLSNAEYNYSIRDLTGVDIRPTKDFPIDSANQAGFDNSGESLNLSPALLNKYLQVARQITEHLVFTPTGLNWSPHPSVTETDRDKYAVLRIIDFYQQQPTNLADYFFAAWQQTLSSNRESLNKIAERQGVSANYLQLIRNFLREETDSIGPFNEISTLWKTLDPTTPEKVAREVCQRISEAIHTIRKAIEPTVENLEGGSVHRGSQTYVLWKNRQYEMNRRLYDRDALMTQTQINERIKSSQATITKSAKETKQNGKEPQLFQQPHASLVLPENPETHPAIHSAFARFASIFPDAFFISERGRDYVGKSRDQQEKGRLLSAGFHSMMGYYRDDAPLYDLILNEKERNEIDQLWDELDFITQAPKRQYIGFLWFERTDSRYMTDPEFDFARAEYDDATNETKIQRLAQVYLAKAERQGAKVLALTAIEEYFERMNERIRWLEKKETLAERYHLQDLLDFASRAYRRPLAEHEQNDLLTFYQTLRFKDQLSHPDAIRETLASIFVSPHFFYRVNEGRPSNNNKATPLTDLALASRLSYFLWSSLPDRELVKLATAGQLSDLNTLKSQVQRLIADPKIRGLATEFGANWLDFRRFETHNAVDRGKFPEFDDELRQAMFDEPIHFLTRSMQQDHPITSLLYGTHTFANPTLAKHYGFPPSAFESLESDEWQRFDQVDQFNRGGILPMAAFLTMNAPGLRTSPVKRGYWVARRVLGEAIPPPPPDVPEIPSDESALGDLTLPEILAKHREHPNCASCHDRFDALGLVFENFGPIGERRSKDLGNRPISTQAVFPNGKTGSGIAGLKQYIQQEREHDFHTNLCRKLLAFALGRTLLMSDEPLIERMLAKLAESDYRFSVLIEGIVTSPQFLNKRTTQFTGTN